MDGFTPLHIFARNRIQNEKVVQMLINNGANVNAQSYDGYTPFHWICLFYENDIISIFLKKGANPFIENKDNITPYDLASEKVKKIILDHEFHDLKEIGYQS